MNAPPDYFDAGSKLAGPRSHPLSASASLPTTTFKAEEAERHSMYVFCSWLWSGPSTSAVRGQSVADWLRIRRVRARESSTCAFVMASSFTLTDAAARAFQRQENGFSAVPPRFVSLLTYRLRRMSIGATKTVSDRRSDFLALPNPLDRKSVV